MKKQSKQKQTTKGLLQANKSGTQSIQRIDPFGGALQRLLEIQPEILAIGPEKGLPEVLSVIAESANSLLGGDFCIVFPYDHTNDRFLLDEVRSGGILAAKTFVWGEPRPGGASRTILRDGEIIIEDYGDPKYIKKYPFLHGSVVDGQYHGAFRDIAQVKAMLGERFQAGEDYFGVLVVSYLEPHQFQPFEIDIAKVFASLAAIAIRNARLYGRYRALIDSAESFTALRTALGPEDTLEKIIQVVHEVLNSDLTVIFPYNQKTDTFLMEQLVAIGENVEGYTFEIPRSEGGTRKILREKEIVHYNLEDAPMEWKDLLGSGPFLQHFDIRSVAAVPLRVSEEAVGVLYINYNKRHKFDQTELDLIEAFANQVALILFNTSVLEREQKARALAETLREAAAGLIQASTLQDALDGTLEQVEKIVPYDGALLLLAEGPKLVSKAARGFEFHDDVLKFTLNPAEDIIFREHGQVTRPVFLSNAHEDPRWKPVPTVDWVRGWLGVRLYARGDVIGEIGLYSRTEGFYNQDFSDALSSFANQATLAIENARFLDELRVISDIQRQVVEKSADLDSVIKTILDNALHLVGANIGQVLLLEEDDFHISISASTSPEDIGRSDLTLDNCITGLAIRNIQTLSIPNIMADPAYRKLYKPPEGYEAKSELVVPLISEGKVIGALNVESPEVAAFSQHHQELLTTIAAVTASAIQTAKGSVREFNLIEQVQEIILRDTFELNDVFALIAESAKRTTNAETGEVWILKGEGILENAAIVPASYSGRAMTSLNVNDSVNGDAILTKSPQLVSDTHLRANYQLASGVEMRSELVVPLLLRGAAIGTINVEGLEPNAFTRHHQVLLQTFAEQAAVAIQAARRQQEQQTITEIQQELLGAAFEQEKVLNLILEKGLGLINASLGQLLLVEGDHLVIRSSTQKEDIGRLVDIDQSVTGLAIKEKTAKHAKDVQAEKEYKELYQPILGDLHSELVVPLIVEDDVIGAINVESEKIGAFTDDDERLLKELARQAALGLRLAEAFAEVESLQDIQKGVLSGEYDVEAASNLILKLAQKLTGAGSGQILLLEDNDTLVIKASTSLEEVNIKKVKVNDSVSGMAIEQEESIYAPDITKEPFASRYKAFLGGKMRSELVVPLRTREKIIGVVNVESPEIDAFTKHDIDILSALAGQAAMAFRIADELELRKRAIEADKMLSAGQIVHRLTGRSGAIRGWIEIIRNEQPELLKTNETFAMAVDDIELKAGEILKLVDELKQRASGQFELMEIPSLIEIAIEKLRNTEEFNKADNRIYIVKEISANIPRVRADTTLSEVFLNLLSNPFKVMQDGGTLTIKTEVDSEWLKVLFTDNGPGIPTLMHETVFSANFSGSQERGHGLGLWWSRAYLRSLGGDLLLESERRQGACFIVKLPVAS